MPPRRITAQNSTTLSAEHKESSPLSELDADGEEPTPVLTFGEPSTPKSAVKVTYGGKRKYKQSPPKLRMVTSTTGEPSHSPRRALSLVESSPNKPRPSGAVRAGRGRGQRGMQSSRARSPSPSSSIENNSMVLSDPEVVQIVDQDLKPRRNTVSGSESRLVDSTKAKGVTGKDPRKRLLPFSSEHSDSEGSSLTSLSSPEVQTVPGPPNASSAPPRLARQFLRTQSHAVRGIASPLKHTPVTQSKSLDNLFAPLDSTDEESCDEVDAGHLVWVCIDTEGNLADCKAKSDDDILWWPAKVQLPKPLMRVALFGRPPGHTSNQEERRLDISNPSTSNVRSMVLGGRIRFNEGSYRLSRPNTLQSSPRKKRKLDLDTDWKEAHDLMVKADQDGGNVLLSSSARKDSAKDKGKGKAKASQWDRNSSEDDFAMELYRKSQRMWRAPSADPLLELPGELILAREGRTRTQYWPAKLLQYVKPQKSSQRPKYKVVFFDGTIRHIERDWFWTTTDDEFATCNLGESTGNYGLDPDNDEHEDAENFDRQIAPEDDEVLRVLSPLPSLPAPDAEVFEYEVPLAEQFEYVKPVLAAVIEDNYGLSKSQHEEFMRGGGARKRVLDSVPLRGSLSAREKEEIAFLVRSWAQRRERRRELGLNVDYPRDKLHTSQNALPVPTPVANGHDDDADSVLTPTSDISIGDTEPLAPSEADAPPSSFVPTEAGTDDEKEASVQQDAPELEVAAAAPEDAISVNFKCGTPQASEAVRIGNTEAVITEVDKAAMDDGVTPATLRMSFHDLDAVEKITYCNNVLLQEAILQLLLWRTGQRKDLVLLSPEEEQRLHDIAMEEGEKTDWVHDILRMRQALDNSMLPSAKSKGKTNGNGAAPGTRTRTRRGA